MAQRYSGKFSKVCSPGSSDDVSVRKEAPVRRSSSAWSPRQPTTSSTASPGEEEPCELRVLIRNGGYYGYVRRRTEFEDDETVAVEDYKLMDEE